MKSKTTQKVTKKKTAKPAQKTKRQTDPVFLERLLRVDHAGEYGAKRIYEGQLRVLGKNPRLKNLISEMKEHEQVHLDFFADAIPKHSARPTALLPM